MNDASPSLPQRQSADATPGKRCSIWYGRNAEAVLQALDEFGFGELGLTSEDFTTADRVVQLGYPPLRIDLLTSIDGV